MPATRPAQQCFERCDFLCAQVDDGLKHKFKFLVKVSCAQVELNGPATLQPSIHFRFEEPIHASPVALGPIESQVSIFQQSLRIAFMTRCDADSDAHANDDLVSIKLVRFPYDVDDALSEAVNIL